MEMILMCKLHNENAIEYINIQTGKVLDLERLKYLKGNAMLIHNPELWCEWDFEKNNELGLDIWDVSRGCKYKVYWICSQCKENTFQYIKNKTRGHRCGYCAGKFASSNNNLAINNPQLASEWHPTKNGKLTPYEVTPVSDIKVWWLGNCGHEWETTVGHRNLNKRKCPFCAGKKVIVGFNNINHTHPQFKKYLLNPQDGDKYTYGSDTKIGFICECGNVMKKQIVSVIANGLNCPLCKDGISFGEKVIYHLLTLNKIKFKHDNTTTWSSGKRYDFIINNEYIIEVDGEHHILQNRVQYSSSNTDTYYTIAENDKFKEEIALSNGIRHYYRISVLNKNMEMIKDNIIESGLLDALNIGYVNWNELFIKSQSSLLIDVCNTYENNELTTNEIASLYGLSKVTIIKYLKTGNKLNLCDYEPYSEKNKKLFNKTLCKELLQFDLEGNLLNKYSSVEEARLAIGVKSSNSIACCCRGINKTSYGYKWLYLEDYEKLQENQNKIS